MHTHFASPKGVENLPKSVKGAGFLNVRSSLPSCSLRTKEKKTPFTSVLASCYISRKPRGPVTQKHHGYEVATPTLKRSFVTPKFLGLVRLHAPAQWLRGVVGATRKGVRTAYPVFLTATLHPMHSKMQMVASQTRYGAKTMTAKPITNADALQHLNSAKAKLQKAVASLSAETVTVESLQSALGQTLSAGRSLKRASEANKPAQNKQEG